MEGTEALLRRRQREVARVPLIYTIVVALAINMLDLTLPRPLYLPLIFQ